MHKKLWLSLPLCFLVGTASAEAPPGRYTDKTRETIFDKRTQLTWQLILSNEALSWGGANTYCGSLALAGGGWRLPNRSELLTLVDPAESIPAIDATAFPNTPSEWFWSSTVHASGSTHAWAVNFGLGDSDGWSRDKTYRVRCVR